MRHIKHFDFFELVQGSDISITPEQVREKLSSRPFTPTLESLKSRDFSKVDTHQCAGKQKAIETFLGVINPARRRRRGFCIGLIGSDLRAHLTQFKDAGFPASYVIGVEFNRGCYEHLQQQAADLPENQRPILVYGELIETVQFCASHQIPIGLLDADGVDTFPRLEDQIYPVLQNYAIPFCAITGSARGGMRPNSREERRVLDILTKETPVGWNDACDTWPSKGVGVNQNYGNLEGHKVSACIKPYARARLPHYDVGPVVSYEGAGGTSVAPLSENNPVGRTPGRPKKGGPMYSLVLTHSRVQGDKTDGGLSVGGGAWRNKLQKEG